MVVLVDSTRFVFHQKVVNTLEHAHTTRHINVLFRFPQKRLRIEDATPDEVITFVLEIERLLGRDRRAEERWGPRTLDLDVLVWGDRVLRTPELELPHPRLRDRRFALRPLLDLVSPEVALAGTDDPLGVLEQRVRDQVVDVIATDW